MKNTLLVTFFIYFLCGCTSRQSHNLFDGEIIRLNAPFDFTEIEPEELEIDVMGGITAHVVDSFLMVLNSSESDYLISLFRLADRSRIGNYIRTGRGPNEFMGIDYDGQFDTRSGEVKIWFGTYPENKLVLFNASQSISENKTIIDREILLDHPQTNTSKNWFVVNDSIILAKEILNEKRLFVYNYQDNNITTTYPLYTNKGLDMNIYFGATIFNIAENKWAQAMMLFDQINLYDLKTKSGKSIRMSDDNRDPEKLEVTQPFEMDLFYRDAFSAHSYFFATYLPNENNYTDIRQFDWEGNLLNIFRVNKRLPYITFDEKNKNIYALDANERLFKIDLASYLK